MSSEDVDKAALVTRLQSALWFTIDQIVQKECKKLGCSYSPEFVVGLTKLVYNRILGAGTDLEAFARHAGRETITIEDVLLLCRGVNGLGQILSESIEGNRET